MAPLRSLARTMYRGAIIHESERPCSRARDPTASIRDAAPRKGILYSREVGVVRFSPLVVSRIVEVEVKLGFLVQIKSFFCVGQFPS